MLEHHHDPVQEYRVFYLPVHVDGPNVEIYMQICRSHNYIGTALESHRDLDASGVAPCFHVRCVFPPPGLRTPRCRYLIN